MKQKRVYAFLVFLIIILLCSEVPRQGAHLENSLFEVPNSPSGSSSVFSKIDVALQNMLQNFSTHINSFEITIIVQLNVDYNPFIRDELNNFNIGDSISYIRLINAVVFNTTLESVVDIASLPFVKHIYVNQKVMRYLKKYYFRTILFSWHHQYIRFKLMGHIENKGRQTMG